MSSTNTDNIANHYERLATAARATLSKRFPDGAVLIQVGSATCEHAAGAREVAAEFRKHLAAAGRTDIVLRQVGCTGRCSCEPIVGVFAPGAMPITYQRVGRELVHRIFTAHVLGGQPVTESILDAGTNFVSERQQLLLCAGTGCGRDLGFDPRERLAHHLAAAGLGTDRVEIIEGSCFGLCSRERRGAAAHVLVRPSGTVYRVASDADIAELVARRLAKGEALPGLEVTDQPLTQRFFELYGNVAFFNRQSRVALRNAGVIDPESLDEYVARDGFAALAKALAACDPERVVAEVTLAKLRGRGGGGYPTGLKWSNARRAEDPLRYLICNADEGDPGAFMDRSMLESDPFGVIEGMLLAAFAIGAGRGFFYVRAEYPLAIRRIEQALAACRQHGLLGKDILGSGFALDLEVRLGAGAFVCGEETALIHSLEGERGQPRIRPPYPSERGLWGHPTVINNVETFANVPVIMSYGGEWFRRIGTDKSGGTKVFALAGKVRHTGLVEVPMGTTLREVVNEIGGGVLGGKVCKAVQTGGPAGGCIPARWLDTAVDFDTLGAVGSIMGSGGMIVLDEDDCMVDVAKFFIAFSQDESCGKCTPCREGMTRLHELLERITSGQAEMSDLDKLERLAKLVKRSSLCGLGRAAPNPVLSTLKHFRAEYEAHVRDRRCPAGKCRALLRYSINPEACVGCTLCAKNCPVSCIAGVRREPHVIDQAACIKCGRCFEVCRFHAVAKT